MSEKPIGEVTHYFDKIGVAIVKASAPVAVGDSITFKGSKTDFTQTVESMQLDHQVIDKAAAGQEFGLKVQEEVHEGDGVFKA